MPPDRHPESEHSEAGQGGPQGEGTEGDGGGQPGASAEPGRAERHRGDGLPRPPPTDVDRQRHREQREHEQRRELGEPHGHPHGARRHVEQREVPGHGGEGQGEYGGPGAHGQHSLPDAGRPLRQSAPNPRDAGQADQDRDHRRGAEEAGGPVAAEGVEQPVQRAGQDRQHEQRAHDDDRLSSTALDHHGLHAAAHVAAASPVVRCAQHVAEHPGGQHRVEELGAVAAAQRTRERDRQAQCTGHHTPPGGRDRGGHQADPERGDEGGR